MSRNRQHRTPDTFADRTILIVLVVVSLALFAGECLPFDVVRNYLDSLSGDGSADAYTTEIHDRVTRTLFGCAVAAGLSATAVLWHHRRHPGSSRRIARHAMTAARDRLVTIRQVLTSNVGALLTLFLVALVLRLPELSQPLRYDEAHTFIHYADRSVVLIPVLYDEPNNHILHSLLVHFTTRIFGDAPASIRLPALLAGCCLPLLVFVGCRGRDRAIAVVAGLLTAVMPSALFYSVNARGYTMAACFLVCGALAANRIARQNSAFDSVLLATSLVLAMWTIPTQVIGAAAVLSGLVVATAWHGRLMNAWRQILAVFGMTAAGVVFVYLPVLVVYGPQHMWAVARPENAAAGHVPLVEYLTGVWRWMCQGTPVWWQVVLILLTAGGMAEFARGVFIRRSENTGGPPVSRKTVVRPLMNGIPAAAAMAIVAGAFLQKIQPPERTWCFIVPAVAAAAAIGIVRLTELITLTLVSDRRRETDGTGDEFAIASARMAHAGLCVCVLLVLLPAIVGPRLSDHFARSPETGYCPAAEDVARALPNIVQPQEPIVAVTPVSAPLVYYAARHGLQESHFNPPERSSRDPSDQRERTAVVITAADFCPTPQAVLEQLSLEDLFVADRATRVLTIDDQLCIWRVYAR